MSDLYWLTDEQMARLEPLGDELGRGRPGSNPQALRGLSRDRDDPVGMWGDFLDVAVETGRLR
mgnify:CR=1 FL=1